MRLHWLKRPEHVPFFKWGMTEVGFERNKELLPSQVWWCRTGIPAVQGKAAWPRVQGQPCYIARPSLKSPRSNLHFSSGDPTLVCCQLTFSTYMSLSFFSRKVGAGCKNNLEGPSHSVCYSGCLLKTLLSGGIPSRSFKEDWYFLQSGAQAPNSVSTRSGVFRSGNRLSERARCH